MPNHVTNVLIASGEDAEKVINELFNENEEITFDKFAPMPEELRGTTSPTSIVSQEDYEKAVAQKKEKEAKGEDISYVSLPITQEMSNKLKDKYGVDNWYDWAKINWSTKWGGYEGYRNSDERCEFQTAWSTPYNAMVTLSKKFPNTKITVQFADEDFGHNVGEYTLLAGLEIEEHMPEGGSAEACKMAMEITGDEYYMDSYIDECYNAEEFKNLVDDNFKEDKFIRVLLDLILEKEYVPYGKHVREFVMQEAVGAEKFEFADKLKNLIEEEK